MVCIANEIENVVIVRIEDRFGEGKVLASEGRKRAWRRTSSSARGGVSGRAAAVSSVSGTRVQIVDGLEGGGEGLQVGFHLGLQANARASAGSRNQGAGGKMAGVFAVR